MLCAMIPRVLVLFFSAQCFAQSFSEIDRLYFNRHRDGNLARSVEILEKRLKDSPRDAQALWRLGRSLIRQGEREAGREAKLALFDRAQEVIGRAIELDGDDPSAHFWHGLALGRKGEARGVMKSLFMIGPLKKRMRRVLQLDPGHGGAHHVLGRMYYRLPAVAGGSNKKAAAELETALRLTPGFTAHYPALAEVYMAQGRKAEAARVLKAFFEVKEPSDPAVYGEHLAEVRALLSGLER